MKRVGEQPNTHRTSLTMIEDIQLSTYVVSGMNVNVERNEH